MIHPTTNPTDYLERAAQASMPVVALMERIGVSTNELDEALGRLEARLSAVLPNTSQPELAPLVGQGINTISDHGHTLGVYADRIESVITRVHRLTSNVDLP